MKPNTSLASDVASLYAWLVGKVCFAQKLTLCNTMHIHVGHSMRMRNGMEKVHADYSYSYTLTKFKTYTHAELYR